MSEAEALLRDVAGEDEWSRHAVLERLRVEGMSGSGVQALTRALGDDADATRRTAARMSLAALASPGSPAREVALGQLRDALRTGRPDLRVLAASALGESGNPAAVEDLVGALHDPEANVVAAAADALGVLGHAGGIGPLAELARAGGFWVRAAAVVSLGRIADPRALSALEAAGREAGLEEPVIEAVRAIGHPDGLGVLEGLADRAPRPALLAAGSILASHPDVEPPGWISGPATRLADDLRSRVENDDDPAAARLLGIAAPPGALELLLDLAVPHRSSEAAVTGLLAAPPVRRAKAILDRLDGGDAETRVTLLSLLPPLEAPEEVRRLVPFLEDPDAGVRAAAAEAIARAPSERAMPLLRDHLDRRGPAPEVVRALGTLDPDACIALTHLLDDPDPAVRTATADALSRCGGPDVGARIADALAREEDSGARAALLRAYGHAAGSEGLGVLEAALSDPDPVVRLAAVEGLAATGAAEALAALRTPLAGTPPESLAALRAIGDLHHAEGAPLLVPFLSSGDRDTRRVAAGAAVLLADAIDRDVVEGLTRDSDEWVRICAVRALARAGAQDRVRELAAGDPSAEVRAEARRLLDGVE